MKSMIIRMPQPLPNLHHLELFYHVARAGGISAAVRTMPYGIQQPAVSGQISRLEADLGSRLFQRRPFQLTAQGKELFDFCAPFFGGLAGIAGKITGSGSRRLRLAAPQTVIREHLPSVLEAVRKVNPDLELSLRDGSAAQALQWLECDEIDLAVTELEGRPPVGMRCEELLTLPLVLFLPPGVSAPKKGLKEWIGRYPLVQAPADQPIPRLFAKGLASRGLHWATGIEIGTLDLILAYTARGFGVGVGVCAPGMSLPKGVKAYPLPDFPRLKVVSLYRGKMSPLAADVLLLLKKKAVGKSLG